MWPRRWDSNQEHVVIISFMKQRRGTMLVCEYIILNTVNTVQNQGLYILTSASMLRRGDNTFIPVQTGRRRTGRFLEGQKLKEPITAGEGQAQTCFLLLGGGPRLTSFQWRCRPSLPSYRYSGRPRLPSCWLGEGRDFLPAGGGQAQNSFLLVGEQA